MVRKELEKARQNLLELSTRNRLLSIPVSPRSKLVRVVDEKSDEVYRLMVESRRKFSFLPKPDSEEDEQGDFDYDENYHLAQPDEELLAEGELAERHTDTKLQTMMESDKLQLRLLRMYYDARTFIEEQGVNILYLGLGQLKWYEDDKSSIERYAPLLLLPVKLERSSAASKIRINALEDEPSDNLSLVARMNELGVKFPEFNIDDGFKPSNYFDTLIESVAGQKRWQVLPNAIVLGFFSFSKFLMYRDLDPENWPKEAPIDNHSLVRSLLLEGFARPDSLINEEQHLDEIISVERLSHVVDSDSSQAIAIEEIRNGKNLIIQGPPGTGKSQTITNLISTAVLDGKSVLFVAEKMAALEVVKRRLVKNGLEPLVVELHSHNTNKRAFLQLLDRTLKLGRPKGGGREENYLRLKQLRGELNSHSLRLNEKIEPCEITPIDIIGNLTMLDQEQQENEIVNLENAQNWSRSDRMEGERIINDIVDRAESMGNLAKHPWRGVQIKEQSKYEIESILKEIESCLDVFENLLEKTKALATALKHTTEISPDDIDTLIWTADRIKEAPKYDKKTIFHEVWNESLDELISLVESGLKYKDIYQQIGDKVIDTAWEKELSDCREHIASHGKSIFRILIKDYRSAITNLRSILNEKSNLPWRLNHKLKLIDQVVEGQMLRRQILENSDKGKRAFGFQWSKYSSDWQEIYNLVNWIAHIRGTRGIMALRKAMSVVENRDAVFDANEIAKAVLVKFEDCLPNLWQKLQLDLSESCSKEHIGVMLNQWLHNREELVTWIRFWSRSEQARELGLGELIDRMMTGKIKGTSAIRVFKRSYFRILYDLVLSIYPELKRFDGQTHSRLVTEFKKTDIARIELARYETLEAHHQKLPRNEGAVGALGIVLGEIAKKRRHMSIRNLMARAGRAVQAIKPVFMMSPLSVAKFLKPGKISFDLVIFDEASQVKPVDALGAISRGKQLVVVGDSKQLPPSTFFSKIDVSEEEDEDEEDTLAAVGDMESILTLSSARGLHSKMLRWHYRSRHSTLIAVSNLEFYDNNLFIIPSPLTEDADYGLKYRPIPNGIYDRGGTRKNKIEAREVALAAINHARMYSSQSLGIAALSVQQRDAIRDELEFLRRENGDTEKFFSSDHRHEPFFIKNLENVQGDERDVIFISVGYGKDQSNAMPYMNFGPINKEGGERRLNVLISRARNRCEVFSSISADEIDLERTKSRGVRVLKSFLNYAETGILGIPDGDTGREMDSPFEEAVKRALEGEGYIVDIQVGVAGFFIDLAVKDPNRPGRYVLGIECDGASYHSSRSARERDRQREDVLKDHGWEIHRIWSTDWFQQPQKELTKTIQTIERYKSNKIGLDESEQNENPVVIERDEPGETDVSKTRPHPYVEAEFDRHYLEIHLIPTYILADFVLDVAMVESPVHCSEVVTRIRENWGLAKAGRRIRNAVLKAIHYASKLEKVEFDGEIVSIPGKEVVVRDRSNTKSPGLRKSDYISSSEVENAILILAKANYGVDLSELLTKVAQLLGIGRTSEKFRDRIKIITENLINSGRIKSENNLLVLSN